jgi:hypothetical protein
MTNFKNMTPEQRSASQAKSLETRRRKKADAEKARVDHMAYAGGLKAKIRALEAQLHSLERIDAISKIHCSVTNKGLLSLNEIINSSCPWKGASGVYFLIENNEIVYIGQSNNVFQRIGEHFRKKRFSRYVYIPCAEDGLDILESLYIHIFNPKLNGIFANGIKTAPYSIDSLIQKITKEAA